MLPAKLHTGRRVRKDFCKRREVAEKHAAEFTADKTRNLIVRLQFNVIRAGLRRINLAYSRISLADVATRLGDVHCRTDSQQLHWPHFGFPLQV